MFRKFVLITGALDFVIGFAVAVPALMDPQPETFTALIPLGAFLCFAAAALIWAAQDLAVRSPIVFWQGLVRLISVGAVAYAVAVGFVGTEQIAVCVFDGIVGAAYVIGCVQFTGAPPGRILLGRTA